MTSILSPPRGGMFSLRVRSADGTNGGICGAERRSPSRNERAGMAGGWVGVNKQKKERRCDNNKQGRKMEEIYVEEVSPHPALSLSHGSGSLARPIPHLVVVLLEVPRDAEDQVRAVALCPNENPEPTLPRPHRVSAESDGETCRA